MAAEIKSKKAGGVKIESIISKTHHKKLKRRCKELNVSIAQRLRDLLQLDIR